MADHVHHDAHRSDENACEQDLIIRPRKSTARPKFHFHDSTDSHPIVDTVPLVPPLPARMMKTVTASATIPLSTEIVSSPYSYTYTQNTGSLLKTRLEAIHRSMNAHVPFSPMQLTSSGSHSEELNPSGRLSHEVDCLISYLKASSNQEQKGKPLESPDDAALIMLIQPYMDSVPVVSKPSRPPTMFRRASSMIFGKSNEEHFRIRTPSLADSVPAVPSQLGTLTPLTSLPSTPTAPSTPSTLSLSSKTISASPYLKSCQYDLHECHAPTLIHQRGIATPLQHLPSKQAGQKAQFVTSTKYPYSIRTVNDVACVYLGVSQKDAQSRNFADFFPEIFRKRLRDHVERSSNSAVRLSGELTEMNSNLVSVWMEQTGSDAFVWVTEKIQKADCSRANHFTLPDEPNASVDHIFRISSLLPTVVLQGNGHLWTPPVIGCAVLVSPSLEIIDYNQAVMSLLLGTEFSLRGELFTLLVPRFLDFWGKVKDLCTGPDGKLIPGIVIPEHKFRALAGVPLSSSSFLSPHPCADHDTAIELLTEFGSLFVDLHLRVVESELISIWLSYSHPSASDVFLNKEPRSDSGNLLLNAVTPPTTPLHSSQLRPLSPRYSEDYADVMDVNVGQHRRDIKLESFEELKLLGKGGYGEVKLVLTPSKSHKIVLKSIYKDRILVDTWSRDRILGTIPNEIRVLNQLRSSNHPHIVQMVDFFEDPRCYYVGMLPCKGPGVMDLFDFIEMQSDEIDPHHLLCIWEEIVSAVAHLHSLGIVHRDLKDENVIMDARGSATLIDFGGSAYINQGPFDVFVGTIDYAAPEIVAGELYDGISQDNWALGIMLYTMIMREPPFKSADDIVAANLPESDHENDDFALCDSLIRKLLSKSPDDRPSASRILEILETEKI